MSNKIYFINYDETNSDAEIKEKIKALGPWLNYFGRSWLIETSLTPQDIYSKLVTDGSEYRILIIEIKIASYWGWMPKEAWTWLSDRITKNTT